MNTSEKIALVEVLWNSWKGGRSLQWFKGEVQGTESKDIQDAVSLCLENGYIKENVGYEHPFGNPYLITQAGKTLLEPVIEGDRINWDSVENWLQ